MTALKKYERLESLGLWRANAQAQRQEVIVSFGDSSVVLSDGNGRPLTHWSLAALERIKTGRPAVYTVDVDGAETLEIEDDAMVKAIEEIRAAIQRARPRPGRLRFLLGAIVLIGFVAMIVFWIPDAAARYATAIVPDAKAAEIGDRAFEHATKLTGQPCKGDAGNLVLRKLEQRLVKTNVNKVTVLDLGKRPSALLPGGHILIDQKLVTKEDNPNLLAGYILLERAAEDETAPLYDLFKSIGTREVLRFLATGEVKEKLLDVYSEARVTGPHSKPSIANLAGLFEVAEFSSKYFSAAEPDYALLAEADSFAAEYEPLLSDEDWLNLQEICG